MSRLSSLHVNTPDIESLGLRLPRISRQSENLPTTDVKNNVDRLPPLSVCLKVRADLHTEAEKRLSLTRKQQELLQCGQTTELSVEKMFLQWLGHTKRRVFVSCFILFFGEGFCMLKLGYAVLYENKCILILRTVQCLQRCHGKTIHFGFFVMLGA